MILVILSFGGDVQNLRKRAGILLQADVRSAFRTISQLNF